MEEMVEELYCILQSESACDPVISPHRRLPNSTPQWNQC